MNGADRFPAARTQPPRGPGGGGSWIDPQALMTIKDLELRAKVVVEGFWNGLHRSPYHGFSVEFTEYRAYSPGDDPRYLDWSLFARSDRYYIKKFQDETNLRCLFLVDQSPSMQYGSLPYSKGAYSNTLAATLAYFLSLQGDAVGLLTFDEHIRDYLPARHRPGHLRHLMLKLETAGGGRATDLAAPLQRVLEIVRKRSLLVFISDFLGPTELLGKNLTALAACGHDIALFQILDPAEAAFSFDQAVVFRDVESGRELYIDPSLARKEYLNRLSAHTRGIQLACLHAGIGHYNLTSDRPLELALYDFLRGRAQRSGRATTRRR